MKPYFYINGHFFQVDVDSESTTNTKIVKTDMYVPTKSWGYRDIQFVNFLGEDIDLTIYSRTTETYQGEAIQPATGGISDFYNTKRTPHAVLKYWSQTGCPCNVQTNIHSHESGKYIIDDGMTQTNLDNTFVMTKLTLLQNETPEEVIQTYYKPEEATNNSGSTQFSASAQEIQVLGDHQQTCNCTSTTPSTSCTATVEPEVITIQKYLQQFGYFPLYQRLAGKIPTTGKYCFYTTQAIKKFQQDHNLSVTGAFNSEVKEEFLNKIGG